jgi:hypothetical protein
MSLGERGKILPNKVTHTTFGGREKVWWESKNNLVGTKKIMAGKQFSRHLCVKIKVVFFQFRTGAGPVSFISRRKRSFDTIFAY